MSKPTLSELLTAGLAALGWTHVEGRSSKYTTFEKDYAKFRIFVGRNGALRAGRTASTSQSLENTQFRERVLTAGTSKLSIPTIAIPELD